MNIILDIFQVFLSFWSSEIRTYLVLDNVLNFFVWNFPFDQFYTVCCNEFIFELGGDNRYLITILHLDFLQIVLSHQFSLKLLNYSSYTFCVRDVVLY